MKNQQHNHLAPTLSLLAFLGLVLIVLSTPLQSQGPEQKDAEVQDQEARPLETLFEGNWSMKGRFRFSAETDWIPTRSNMVAEARLEGQILFRQIEAAQINLFAIDILTYNPKTGTAQYFYWTNREPTALVFEGGCENDCRSLSFQQVCGPSVKPESCNGRTTIDFETDDRFVARDYRPSSNGNEFMSREVFYNRSE